MDPIIRAYKICELIIEIEPEWIGGKVELLAFIAEKIDLSNGITVQSYLKTINYIATKQGSPHHSKLAKNLKGNKFKKIAKTAMKAYQRIKKTQLSEKFLKQEIRKMLTTYDNSIQLKNEISEKEYIEKKIQVQYTEFDQWKDKINEIIIALLNEKKRLLLKKTWDPRKKSLWGIFLFLTKTLVLKSRNYHNILDIDIELNGETSKIISLYAKNRKVTSNILGITTKLNEQLIKEHDELLKKINEEPTSEENKLLFKKSTIKNINNKFGLITLFNANPLKEHRRKLEIELEKRLDTNGIIIITSSKKTELRDWFRDIQFSTNLKGIYFDNRLIRKGQLIQKDLSTLLLTNEESKIEHIKRIFTIKEMEFLTY